MLGATSNSWRDVSALTVSFSTTLSFPSILPMPYIPKPVATVPATIGFLRSARIFGVNLINSPVMVVINPPSLVPNNKYPASKVGQKSPKNLIILLIFVLLSGSPNHSINLNSALPKNIVVKYSIILSKIDLTGATIDFAAFINTESFFSNLFSLTDLFSFSSFFLSLFAFFLSKS